MTEKSKDNTVACSEWCKGRWARMPVAEPITYRAFLSYSHRDAGWARWLHSALERYQVPKDLVGRPTPYGLVPRSLRPIFRDRDDFSAGASLGEQTLAALQASDSLVVICSPSAAKSAFVNEEIRRYKTLGRGNHIIPIIVEGMPDDDQLECFSPALRFKLRPDGSLSEEREEPIAADARPQGDGKEIAKHKVIAGLLGVRLDEILRRAEVARRRRNKLWAGLAAVLLILTIVSTGSAIFAYRKLVESNDRLDQAIELAYGFVTEATAMSERVGVPQQVTLDLLDKADAALTHLIDRGADTPRLRYRKALMLLSFSDSYRTLGQLQQAFDKASEARRLMQGLTAGDPKNVAWQRDLALADFEIGETQSAQDDFAAALASYQSSLAIFAPHQKDNTRDGRLDRLILVYNRIGQMQEYLGRSSEALAAYQSGIVAVKPLADASPANVRMQRNLGFLYDHVGHVLYDQGHDAAALENERTALKIVQAVAVANSTNSGYQRDVATMQSFYIASALKSEGRIDEALNEASAGVAIYEKLSAADPKNALWLEQGIRARAILQDLQLAKGLIDQASKTAQVALASAQNLAQLDPKNPRWQFELGLAHTMTAEVQAAKGENADALSNYREGLAAMAPVLAQKLEGFNLIVLSVLAAYQNADDLLAKMGDSTGAVAGYRVALAAAQKLILLDPENIVWLRQYLRIQSGLATQGDDAPARLALIVGTLRKLKDTDRLNPEMAELLSLATSKLAAAGKS